MAMDGEQRKKSAARIFGHRNAIQSGHRNNYEGCGELGVKYLTFMRLVQRTGEGPKEVDGLMGSS